ncbi:MAG: efflux RND transporter periplasmic adaptor subunit [Melioribacteraceae bacterium]
MKKNIKQLALLFAISFSIIFVSSCGDAEAEQEAKVEEKNLVNVEVEKIQGENYTSYIKIIGAVQPLNKANLSFLEGGKIRKYLKSKGSYVAKGETIVELDNAVAKASMDAAKAKYDFAEINFAKQEKIYNDNISSEFQYLKSKSERDQAKANYELMNARYNNTFIVANFSGTIDAKYIEEGEFAPPGTPVISLVQNSVVKVVAGVPEKFAAKIKRNQNVKVKVGDVDSDLIDGKISFVGSTLDGNNRTFPVEIIIKNKNKLLKPGMIAEVSVEQNTYPNMISIPDDVVTRTDNGYMVFVFENGIAKSNPIKILDRFENKVAVENGLENGQQLIVVGFQNLVDGQEVTIVE